LHLRRAVESYASRSTKGASGATKASTMFGPPARAPRKSFRSLRFQPSGQAGQSQSKHLLFQNPVAWRYSGGFEFVVCVVPTVASSCLLVVGFKRDLKIKPSRRLSSEALRPLSAGVRKIRRSPPRLFFAAQELRQLFYVGFSKNLEVTNKNTGAFNLSVISLYSSKTVSSLLIPRFFL